MSPMENPIWLLFWYVGNFVGVTLLAYFVIINIEKTIDNYRIWKQTKNWPENDDYKLF